MKLFYTCPIKAAYMVREFGVYYEPEWPVEDLLYFASNLYAEQSPSDPVQQEKFYISIDSLPIFEPHDGDKDEDGYVYHANLKWWLWSGYDGKGNYHVFNKGSNSKTAQRNGKVLIAPESEE